jgi:hypothetical protein
VKVAVAAGSVVAVITGLGLGAGVTVAVGVGVPHATSKASNSPRSFLMGDPAKVNWLR